MTVSGAQATLHELSRLETVARRPRTEVWFPLLVFALLDLPGAVLALVVGREHLGLYYLPASVLGGILCAWHYRRRGRTTGLQAPALGWMVVALGVLAAGATSSSVGREHDWDLLNLAGPSASRMVGYALLALWARSTSLLVVVGAIGATIVLVLAVADGNAAISLQIIGMSSAMLPLAGHNWREGRPAR